MELNRALFVTLSAFESAAADRDRAACLVEMLQDYCAMGHRLLVVTESLVYKEQAHSSCQALQETLRTCLQEHWTTPIDSVVLLGNSFDPGPFWDVARRFNLVLGGCTMASLNGEHLAAARNAGVGRVEQYEQLSGMAA